jgi:hypothetical protein
MVVSKRINKRPYDLGNLRRWHRHRLGVEIEDEPQGVALVLPRRGLFLVKAAVHRTVTIAQYFSLS